MIREEHNIRFVSRKPLFGAMDGPYAHLEDVLEAIDLIERKGLGLRELREALSSAWVKAK